MNIHSLKSRMLLKSGARHTPASLIFPSTPAQGSKCSGYLEEKESVHNDFDQWQPKLGVDTARRSHISEKDTNHYHNHAHQVHNHL
jgi:hypothetical protein